MYKKLNINWDEASEEYSNGASTYDLANKYSCRPSTVYNNLKNKGVRIRTRGDAQRINLPWEELYNEYVNGLSLSKLAKKYKTNKQTIRCNFIEKGYKTRPIKIFKYDWTKIYEEYVNGKSQSRLAIEYSCDKTTIRTHFKNIPIKKISHNEALRNERNGQWKGDWASDVSIHKWVRARKPKPDTCEICNLNKPYDIANVSGQYKRDINDFRWLCRKCHMISDGRINNLKKHDKK
jgi:Mor family transcriptional regulator